MIQMKMLMKSNLVLFILLPLVGFLIFTNYSHIAEATNQNATVITITSIVNCSYDEDKLKRVTTQVKHAFYDEMFSTRSNFIATILQGTNIIGPSCWSGNFFTIFESIQLDENHKNSLIWPKHIDKPTVTSAYHVGPKNITLMFDNPVQLLFRDKANQKVGYTPNLNTPITEITRICENFNRNPDNMSNNIPDGGECKITIGSALYVYTKHFTYFTTWENESDDSSTTSGSVGLSNPNSGGNGGVNGRSGSSSLSLPNSDNNTPPSPPSDNTSESSPNVTSLSTDAKKVSNSVGDLTDNPNSLHSTPLVIASVPEKSDVPVNEPASNKFIEINTITSVAAFVSMSVFSIAMPLIHGMNWKPVGFSMASLKSFFVARKYWQSTIFKKTQTALGIAFLTLAMGSILSWLMFDKTEDNMDYVIATSALYLIFYALIGYHHVLWYACLRQSENELLKEIKYVLVILPVLGVLGYVYFLTMNLNQSDLLEDFLLQVITIVGLSIIGPITIWTWISQRDSILDVKWALVGTGLIAVMIGIIPMNWNWNIGSLTLSDIFVLVGCGLVAIGQYVLSTKFATNQDLTTA